MEQPERKTVEYSGAADAAGEAAFSAAAARLFVMERVPSSELHPDYACEEIAVVRLRRRA